MAEDPEKEAGLRIIPANEILEKIKKGEDVKYPQNILIDGDLDIRNLGLQKENDRYTIRSSINLIDSEIKGKVNFDDANFVKGIIFDRIQFDKDASFNRSKFTENADFHYSTFNGIALFDSTEFRKEALFAFIPLYGITQFNYAHFQKAHFIGDAYFTDILFRGKVNFDNAIFEKNAFFLRSRFSENASFEVTKFKKSANFDQVNFGKDAKFNSSKFGGTTVGDAHFHNIQFMGQVDFDNVTFEKNAFFCRSQFSEKASFEKTNFKENANFDQVNFAKITKFNGSKFDGAAVFEYAEFNGNVFFEQNKMDDPEKTELKVEFKKSANFDRAKFKEIFFVGTSFGDRISLNGANYEKLYTRWDEITKLKYNSRLNIINNVLRHNYINCCLIYDDTVYLSLIENFKKLGFLEDADNCYYYYRTKRRELFPPWQKAVDGLLELSYGYGVRPIRPLIFASFFFLAFGLLYFIKGDYIGIAKAIDFKEALNLSLTVILSGAKIVVEPTYPGKGLLLYLILNLEKLLGSVFLFLFLISVGRTIVR